MPATKLTNPPCCQGILPREEALPTSVALAALPAALCRQLDCLEATGPVISWVFETPARAYQRLLGELYRYHRALRPISVLDVLALLLIAGPDGERVGRRVRTLVTGGGEKAESK